MVVVEEVSFVGGEVVVVEEVSDGEELKVQFDAAGSGFLSIDNTGHCKSANENAADKQCC